MRKVLIYHTDRSLTTFFTQMSRDILYSVIDTQAPRGIIILEGRFFNWEHVKKVEIQDAP